MKQFLDHFVTGIRNGKNYRLFVATKNKKQNVIDQYKLTPEEANHIECQEITQGLTHIGNWIDEIIKEMPNVPIIKITQRGKDSKKMLV